MTQITNLDQLSSAIHSANVFFQDKALRQVNKYLTLRNWIIGYYIVEYEQNGKDRAEYGSSILNNLVDRLKEKNIKGLSKSNLKVFRTFYISYPEVICVLSDVLQESDFQSIKKGQTLSGLFKGSKNNSSKEAINAGKLVNRLCFSHFIELIGLSDKSARLYYETYCIDNNCSVRELRRAIDSRLHMRLKGNVNPFSDAKLSSKDIIKDPYILEFLELEEKPADIESELEQRVIDHIQKFLIELGNGFCFEARQKRISIEGTHLYVDLVFYHRILKCHVLVELKMKDFSYADAGQMNVYINYYKDNEMVTGDNPPIGIILCTDKNSTLVKYATSGMSDNIFVSQYLSKLPSEEDLRKIVEEEKKSISLKAPVMAGPIDY